MAMKRKYGGTYQPRKAMKTGPRKQSVGSALRAGYMLTKVPRPVLPARDTTNRNFHGETKVLDQGIGATNGYNAALALNTTGVVIALNIVNQGASFNQRLGNKIEMKSIRLTGIITPLTNARFCPVDYARVMMVYDRQPSNLGTVPAMTTILENTDVGGANYTSAFAGVNMNNRERFLVLSDRRIYIPQVTTTVATGVSLFNAAAGNLGTIFPMDCTQGLIIDDFRKLGNLVTHFTTSTTSIGDISSGSLLLLTLTENNAAGSEGFAFNWNSRLRYRDT